MKELVELLRSVYSKEGEVHFKMMYDICKAFFLAEMGEKSLTRYYMELRKSYAELNFFSPFSTDVKIQKAQREKIAVMNILAGLLPKFETPKTDILCSSEISLEEAFNKLLQIEKAQSIAPLQSNNALGGQSSEIEHNKLPYKSSRGIRLNTYDGNSYTQRQDSSGIMCYYCHQVGHVKRDCRKLLNKSQKTRYPHVASSDGASDNLSKNDTSVMFILTSVDELAKFQLYQGPLKSSSTCVTAITRSGKCLVWLFSK